MQFVGREERRRLLVAFSFIYLRSRVSLIHSFSKEFFLSDGAPSPGMEEERGLRGNDNLTDHRAQA